MKLIIRQKAADDLDKIHDWIALRSPAAARRVVRGIWNRMESILLRELVETGRPGRAKGTRELIEGPYVIVYKANRRKDVVVIVAIFHSARER